MFITDKKLGYRALNNLFSSIDKAIKDIFNQYPKYSRTSYKKVITWSQLLDAFFFHLIGTRAVFNRFLVGSDALIQLLCSVVFIPFRHFKF